jgi:NAD+ synthase (glutamine-hydrolysing)
VDIEDVRSYRSQKSRALQATKQPAYERVEVNFSLSADSEDISPLVKQSPEIEVTYLLPEEEIAYGPACWLWDYLRRSKQAGFFLPLSGGIDSCATAIIVHSMCRLVYKDVCEGKNPQVLKDLLTIVGKPSDSKWLPDSPQAIASELFHTVSLSFTTHSTQIMFLKTQFLNSLEKRAD